jgi:MoaA/NifB/PqqE/SkfB family radical SAM enzyme
MLDGIGVFNQVLQDKLANQRKFLFKRKNYIPTFIRLGDKLKKQQTVRAKIQKEDGLTMPPIMILSITKACNLNCKGCYSFANNEDKDEELSLSEIDSIIRQSIDLGVSVVMVAGGEPLIKKGIIDVLCKYKDIIFVLFTNGLLMDEKMTTRLRGMKNIVPVISLEGDKETTDERRGSGVYDKVTHLFKKLNAQKLLFGTSITLTKQNYDRVMNDQMLSDIENMGCAVTFLIEYVPCDGQPELCLTETQKRDLIDKESYYADKFSMLMIPLPGDEDMYGGCLAAGRGFLYVGSNGNLEPCPFAPYSDVNLKTTPLKQAVKSKLLEQVRQNHGLLKEGKGGCTLVNNKQWLEGLTKS